MYKNFYVYNIRIVTVSPPYFISLPEQQKQFNTVWPTRNRETMSGLLRHSVAVHNSKSILELIPIGTRSHNTFNSSVFPHREIVSTYLCQTYLENMINSYLICYFPGVA